MDDSLLARHYETCSEGPRLEASRVRRLERDTTLHVLDRHVSPAATVLELGAGHGAYSLHFARRGHRVLATDILPGNVRAIRTHAQRERLRTLAVRQADATALNAVADRTFDAVLCLGPYYHLRTRELRHRCLLECRRVARDDGVVAVSYINRAFAVGHLLETGRGLSADQYGSLMQADDLRVDYPDDFFNVAHFSTADAVAAEVRSSGFDIVDHAGTDGIHGFRRHALEGLDEQAYRDYRAHHLETCSWPSAPEASAHCLVVLEKR
jgi:2-polyprenyl-3-methyl-5-hydroxy-6-metoxy-1,4-benzoquinol methylase